MLGLDFSEILIIGVVALVVVGPKELPEMMRTVGRWVAQARRMASEFQGQMNDALREAELDDVKKHVDDLRSLSPKNLIADQLSSITSTLDDVKRETDAQLAHIEAGVTAPTADAAPEMAEAEIAARIDAAAELPAAPIEPVIAPEPVVAEATPIEGAEPKKDLSA